MISERTVALLRDPDTREPLELVEDCLVNAASGARYPIREGIPVFVSETSGRNRKYQELYDRTAALYDPVLAISRWLKFNKDLRLEFVRELEIPAGARVLEVSVGTGANLKYFPADAEFFGLDLSWGMLRQCRKRLDRGKRRAALFQGEAERRLPGLRRYFRNRTEAVAGPLALVPAGMREAQCREIAWGWMYCLTFRKP
jgi:uncharacterized protein YbaR (Trm112 family)